MVAPDYFLSRISLQSQDVPGVEYVPLTQGMTLSGRLKLSAIVKTYEQRPSVVWSVNGDPASPKTEPGVYEVFVDTAKLHSKQAVISINARDSKGKLAGHQQIVVNIAGPGR